MIKPKLFKQSEGYCGPSSLKMILSLYRINKSEKYLARLAKATRKKGCSGENMVNAAKKLGFNAYLIKKSSINELKKLSRKRIPVIVAWKSPEEGGHYSVVVGFEKNRILLADPHFGKIKKQDIKWFDKKWKEIINKKKKIRRGAIIMYK